MSRRRELGLDTSWKYASQRAALPRRSLDCSGRPAIAGNLRGVAHGGPMALYGAVRPHVIRLLVDFLGEVVSTARGLMLIGIGCLIGLCFAAVSLAISVVSFLLLLDREGGGVMAVATSIKAGTGITRLQWRSGASLLRQRY